MASEGRAQDGIYRTWRHPDGVLDVHHPDVHLREETASLDAGCEYDGEVLSSHGVAFLRSF